MELSRKRSEQWHLGKEIPLALVAAVLLQTAGGIWWMAQLSGSIENLKTLVSEIKSERYTREDARLNGLILDQRFASQQNIDREFDRRLSGIENRTERIERK